MEKLHAHIKHCCLLALLITALLPTSVLSDMEEGTQHSPYEIVDELVSIWPFPFIAMSEPLIPELEPHAEEIHQMRDIGRSNYAGIYFLMDSDVLHVNIVESLPNDIFITDNPDVIVHRVKYTLAELNEIFELVSENSAELEKYGFWFPQIDVVNNRLILALFQDAKGGIERGMATLGVEADMYAVYIHDGSVILI